MGVLSADTKQTSNQYDNSTTRTNTAAQNSVALSANRITYQDRATTQQALKLAGKIAAQSFKERDGTRQLVSELQAGARSDTAQALTATQQAKDGTAAADKQLRTIGFIAVGMAAVFIIMRRRKG